MGGGEKEGIITTGWIRIVPLVVNSYSFLCVYCKCRIAGIDSFLGSLVSATLFLYLSRFHDFRIKIQSLREGRQRQPIAWITVFGELQQMVSPPSGVIKGGYKMNSQQRRGISAECKWLW